MSTVFLRTHRCVGSADVWDSVAPATGTPETGGWSTRELRTILRGLDGLNLIGADIVEVAVSTSAVLLYSKIGSALTYLFL